MKKRKAVPPTQLDLSMYYISITPATRHLRNGLRHLPLAIFCTAACARYSRPLGTSGGRRVQLINSMGKCALKAPRFGESFGESREVFKR